MNSMWFHIIFLMFTRDFPWFSTMVKSPWVFHRAAASRMPFTNPLSLRASGEEYQSPIPSGYVKITIENDHLQWVFPIKIVIFHSYVSLSEGSWLVYFMENPNLIAGWWFPLWLGGFMWFPKIWWISGYPFYGVDVEMGVSVVIGP